MLQLYLQNSEGIALSKLSFEYLISPSINVVKIMKVVEKMHRWLLYSLNARNLYLNLLFEIRFSLIYWNKYTSCIYYWCTLKACNYDVASNYNRERFILKERNGFPTMQTKCSFSKREIQKVSTIEVCGYERCNCVICIYETFKSTSKIS